MIMQERLAIVSDIHVGGYDRRPDLFWSDNKLINVFTHINRTYKPHAWVIPGDYTDRGTVSQFRRFAMIVMQSEMPQVYLFNGNHEFFTSEKAVDEGEIILKNEAPITMIEGIAYYVGSNVALGSFSGYTGRDKELEITSFADLTTRRASYHRESLSRLHEFDDVLEQLLTLPADFKLLFTHYPLPMSGYWNTFFLDPQYAERINQYSTHLAFIGYGHLHNQYEQNPDEQRPGIIRRGNTLMVNIALPFALSTGREPVTILDFSHSAMVTNIDDIVI